MALTDEKPADYTLKGRVIVFTGPLSTLTREQATEMVVERGGIVEPRITHRTDYLVYGAKMGNTKRSAASRLGTSMRSEQWLLAAIVATTPGFVPRKTIPTAAGWEPSKKIQNDEPAGAKVRRVRVA